MKRYLMACCVCLMTRDMEYLFLYFSWWLHSPRKIFSIHLSILELTYVGWLYFLPFQKVTLLWLMVSSKAQFLKIWCSPICMLTLPFVSKKEAIPKSKDGTFFLVFYSFSKIFRPLIKCCVWCWKGSFLMSFFGNGSQDAVQDGLQLLSSRDPPAPAAQLPHFCHLWVSSFTCTICG